MMDEVQVASPVVNPDHRSKAEKAGEKARYENAEIESQLERYKSGFVNTIKVFMGLLEMRNLAEGGHGRRVASVARAIAVQLQLDGDSTKNVELGALLHDIGKIGLPDHLLNKEEGLMTPNERTLFRQHPLLGYAAIPMVDGFEEIGPGVKYHHERWDGRGYPDGLKGENIPLAARIIGAADAIDRYAASGLKAQVDFIDVQLRAGNSGTFDPSVLLAMRQVVSSPSAPDRSVEIAVRIRDLKDGMVLSRDLLAITGILLLPKGEVMRQRHVDRLVIYERQKLVGPEVYVWG